MDSNFLIGGDPEFPVYDKKLKKYITAENLVKGTKKEPSPIAIDGCFEQLDCVGIEFTLPPAPEYRIYQHIVNKCIKYTNEWLLKINPNYKLAFKSSAEYDPIQLESEIANEFGCEPSYSVYRNDVSFRPNPIDIGNLRSFGYHLHYGWNHEIPKKDLLNFIILNDIFLGFPSIYKDKDNKRREIYGNLSDHRIIIKTDTEYKDILSSNRVEYRSLGCGIINHTTFIDKGILMIKDIINKNIVKEIVELYYDDLYQIDETNFDVDLCENLKNKLIKNNNWNE